MTNNNKNLDSVRKTNLAPEASRNTKQIFQPPINFYSQKSVAPNDLTLLFEQPKRKIGFHVPKLKTATLLIATVVLTATISIAGQGYASYKEEPEVSDNLSNNWNQTEITLDTSNQSKGIGINTITEQTQSISVVLDQPTITYSEPEETSAEVKQRTAFLKQYLTERKSPAAPYAEDIAQLSQWKLVVGVMRAESQWCKKHVTSTKNCHGIGGAWNLRKYATYPESFKDVNRIIQTKYVDFGLNTPEKMVNKYVGHASPNWVAAVKAELANFENVP
jgi:hypothetical protein